jgi:hypothetical protein
VLEFSRRSSTILTVCFFTGLLGSPPCQTVADVEMPWRRGSGRAEDLPELPAPTSSSSSSRPPLQLRDAPAERDALEVARRDRTDAFVADMWKGLE